MQNNIKVEPKEGVSILEIREGKSLPLQEPQPVNIVGVIESPCNWIEKRKEQFNVMNAHILVNRNDMRIKLTIDENNHYQDSITGGLDIHPDFKKWNINTGEGWTTKQLSEFVKMNRSCFESKDIAMKLSNELQNIKIKVEKEAEKSDNNRGDYKAMIAQKVIESNIPDRFILNVPIFKGQKPSRFEVEIYISPESYSCSFVSPEVNDIIHNVRDSIIDEQLAKIDALMPQLVVIEQ
jgi:hypothetical protein